MDLISDNFDKIMSKKNSEVSKFRDHQINQADSPGPQRSTAKDQHRNPRRGVARRKGKQGA